LSSGVLQSEALDVEQVLQLRAVRVNELVYAPELTLYYNACLLCCQSGIVIVRLYAYSLLRGAPVMADIRHLFNVFKYAVQVWTRGPVSFEFTASLSLLLSRLKDFVPTPTDESVWEVLWEQLGKLAESANFD
jgi:hypothetical protein